jgi:hypothetical protein
MRRDFSLSGELGAPQLILGGPQCVALGIYCQFPENFMRLREQLPVQVISPHIQRNATARDRQRGSHGTKWNRGVSQFLLPSF